PATTLRVGERRATRRARALGPGRHRRPSAVAPHRDTRRHAIGRGGRMSTYVRIVVGWPLATARTVDRITGDVGRRRKPVRIRRGPATVTGRPLRRRSRPRRTCAQGARPGARHSPCHLAGHTRGEDPERGATDAIRHGNACPGVRSHEHADLRGEAVRVILLLSTSDTDLLSARSSGADYRLANPARINPGTELDELLRGVDLVVVRI